MDEELTKAVEAVKTGLYWRLVVRWSLACLACVSFLAGTAFLLLRLFEEKLPLWIWDGMICVIVAWLICFIAVLWLCSRRLPSRSEIVAWLDAHSEGGGLLMAAEAGETNWKDKGTRIVAPTIHWNTWGREMLLALCAVAFFLCSAFAPQRINDFIGGKRTLDIQDETAKLEEQLQTLESILDEKPEKLEEMKRILTDIQEHNFAGDSAKTYELLDVLQERIDKEFSEYYNETMDKVMDKEKLAAALEQLSKLQETPEAVTAASEIGSFMSKLAESDKELASLLKELADSGQIPSVEQLADAASQQTLTPEQQKKLAEFLQNNAKRIKEKLKEMAEKMKKNGCNSCQNTSMSQSAQFDLDALKEWLESEGEGQCADSLSIALSMPGVGGTGGVSRGRGDAPLEYTNTAKEFEHNTSDVGLDGLARPDNADSSVLKRTLVAPQEQNETEAAAAGQLQGGKGNVKSSSKPIHPQHRREIENYFKK